MVGGGSEDKSFWRLEPDLSFVPSKIKVQFGKGTPSRVIRDINEFNRSAAEAEEDETSNEVDQLYGVQKDNLKMEESTKNKTKEDDVELDEERKGNDEGGSQADKLYVNLIDGKSFTQGQTKPAVMKPEDQIEDNSPSQSLKK